MSEAYLQEMDQSRLKYYDQHEPGSHYDFSNLPICRFDPNNINQASQNQPELVVRDLARAFDLTETQKQYVRYSLLIRGVNKWLYARRQFIDLKHIVKKRMKESEIGSKEYYIYQQLNEWMQHIAKTPRWVEWPTKVRSDLPKAEEEVIVKTRAEPDFHFDRGVNDRW